MASSNSTTHATGSPKGDLRRLGLVKRTVENGASTVTSLASTLDKVYKSSKGYIPGFLQPTVGKAEQLAGQVLSTAESIAAPVVAKATDVGLQALQVADSQVDFLLTSADKTLAGSKKGVSDSLNAVRELHDANLKTFSETTQAYYTYMQQIADWASTKLNPVTGGQAAVDTLRAATNRALELTDPDEAAKALTDAWAAFASVPVVSKLLETADPVTNRLLASFYTVHDKLVGWGLYKRVVDTGASTLSWAASTTPYKLGAQYVYPLVQPVADPALAKLSHSRVITSTLDYWKPSATAA